jgi:hypothetical protein
MPEPPPFSGHDAPAILEVEPKIIRAIRKSVLTGFDSAVTVNLLERDALSNAAIVPGISGLMVTTGNHAARTPCAELLPFWLWISLDYPRPFLSCSVGRLLPFSTVFFPTLSSILDAFDAVPSQFCGKIRVSAS